MFLMTVQNEKVVKEIMKSKYKPCFWESKFAFQSERFLSAYNLIIEELHKKLKKQKGKTKYDSCMWGWVNKPFIDFHLKHLGKKSNKKLYAIFCNIPEKKMVFSDFDKYSDYLDGKTVDSFMVENFESGDTRCLQCSFEYLLPENISTIIDVEDLKGLEKDSLDEMWMKTKRKNLVRKFSTVNI